MSFFSFYYITHLGCIDNTPHNCDEVKSVPGVFEVILKREKENKFKLTCQGKRLAKKCLYAKKSFCKSTNQLFHLYIIISVEHTLIMLNTSVIYFTLLI
jgi:hypothetical protein